MTKFKDRYTITPLDGTKYYGTEINGPTGSIQIWGVNRIHKPSNRELAFWTPEDQSDIMCDGHYEDAGDLEVAEVIAKALNEYFDRIEPTKSTAGKNGGENV